MGGALRISEAASLALHAAIFLAGAASRRASCEEMADALSVSEAHLAKVLNQLARAEILLSARGPKGGFSLKRPPREISLLDVYSAIEGPLSAPTCLFRKPVCGKAECTLGGMMHEANGRIQKWLSETRLSNPDLALEQTQRR